MDLWKIPFTTTNSQGGLSEDEDSSEELKTLWVGSIKEKVDEEILFELFVNSGPVLKVTIPRNKDTRKPKGFAFVLFEHKESVKYAIQQMSGIKLFGQAIKLKSSPSYNRRSALSDASNQVYEVNQNVIRKPLGLEENNCMKSPLQLTENQNCFKTRIDTSQCSSIKVTLMDPCSTVSSLCKSTQILKGDQEGIINKESILLEAEGDQEGIVNKESNLPDQNSVDTNRKWILTTEERNILLNKVGQRERSRERQKRRERNGENGGDQKYHREKFKSSTEKSKSIRRPRERDDRGHGDRSRSRRRHMERRESDDRKNGRYLRDRSWSRSKDRGTRERGDRNNRKHFRERSHSPSRHSGTREEKSCHYKRNRNKEKEMLNERLNSQIVEETKSAFKDPVPREKQSSGSENPSPMKNELTKSTEEELSRQVTLTSQDLEEGEIL